VIPVERLPVLLWKVKDALTCYASTLHAQAHVQRNPAIKAARLEEVALVEALEQEVHQVLIAPERVTDAGLEKVYLDTYVGSLRLKDVPTLRDPDTGEMFYSPDVAQMLYSVHAAAAPAGAAWKHLKTGNSYQEVCRAHLNVSDGPPQEGDEVVIYRGEDGRLWAREDQDFRRRFKLAAVPGQNSRGGQQ
jgi:hypothetical protein